MDQEEKEQLKAAYLAECGRMFHRWLIWSQQHPQILWLLNALALLLIVTVIWFAKTLIFN